MKQGTTYQKLGDVCDVINGLWKGKKPPYINVGVIRNANFTKSFTLRYDNIEYLDVEVRQYEKRKLQKGDLIVEKSGGSEKQPVGRAVLFEREDGEFSFSNFTSILRIKDKDSFNSKFLFYFLLFIYKRGDTLGMQKATTGIHNIEFEKYLNISVPAISIAEQEWIVERLDAAFAQIDELKSNAERQLAEARALFQSALKEMLEPKDGWMEKTLKEVCSLITDGTHHSPPNDQKGKYKYITAKNIRIWGLDTSNITYVSEEIHKEIIARCNPKKGDVLYIKDGATTGIAIVNPLEEEFSMLSSVALIRPYKDVLSSEFLCYTLNSPSIYNQARNQMDGAAITRVTLVKIKGFVVSIPPIIEQQRIVTRLDSLKSKVNCLEENFTKISQECDALKQALLRQIFE